jgi:large subunit ribosomal protein L25
LSFLPWPPDRLPQHRSQHRRNPFTPSQVQRRSAVPEVSIKAESRSEFGKGAARRVRRAGQVPGVLYGHGTDVLHIALPGHELGRALRTANVLLEVSVDGQTVLALPKAVQRDVVHQVLEHIDLVIVKRGEKVSVDVSVTVIGKVVGGLCEMSVGAVSVEAEATHIPTELILDIDGREIGDVVRASDLTLPEGSTLAGDPDLVVAHIVEPQSAEEPEEAPEATEGADEAEPEA